MPEVLVEVERREALGGADRGLYFPLQKGWREW
jgi:hypothetical protein